MAKSRKRRSSTTSNAVASRSVLNKSSRHLDPVLHPPIPPRVSRPGYGMRRDRPQRADVRGLVLALKRPNEPIRSRSPFEHIKEGTALHRSGRNPRAHVFHAGGVYSPCRRRKLIRRSAILAAGKGGVNHTRNYQKRRSCT